MREFEAAYAAPLNMATLRAAERDDRLVRFAAMHLDYNAARELESLRLAKERLDQLEAQARWLGER